MGGFSGWLTSSGVIQGVIIGATFAFLTTILILNAVAKRETRTVNGWSAIRRAGQPGTGLFVRAALQKALPVVNVFEEAAYWTADTDSSDKKLTGAHSYRLHFPPGQLPPNDAFWSLTATDTAGYMLRSSAGRSSVDDHSGLMSHPDGSVDVDLQAREPGGTAQNWLPTPPGRFKLMLRVYLPSAAIMNGDYEVPPVVEVA